MPNDFKYDVSQPRPLWANVTCNEFRFFTIAPQGGVTTKAKNNMPSNFKYDVFLSHSAKDKSRRGGMRELANRLKKDKLRAGRMY